MGFPKITLDLSIPHAPLLCLWLFHLHDRFRVLLQFFAVVIASCCNPSLLSSLTAVSLHCCLRLQSRCSCPSLSSLSMMLHAAPVQHRTVSAVSCFDSVLPRCDATSFRCYIVSVLHRLGVTSLQCYIVAVLHRFSGPPKVSLSNVIHFLNDIKYFKSVCKFRQENI